VIRHLKVIRTGDEDKSVGMQEFALRAKGDVTELRIDEQVTEDGSQVRVVVVPLQTEHIWLCHPSLL